jgi:hypothetical protein
MMILSGAVDRLLALAIAKRMIPIDTALKAAEKTVAAKRSEKHAPIEIGGSVLRYTTSTGKRHSAHEPDVIRDRQWNRLRRMVAANARLR